MEEALFWIEKLNLRQHPEGGWYSEVYRANETIPQNALPGRFSSARNFSTSIYYLLEKNSKSNFHRIKSDEIWHFYTGNSAVEIILIEKGVARKIYLGPDFMKGETFQIIIPHETWFAAHLCNKNGYALVGCTVSPGFNFDDFELADKNQLITDYPHLSPIIREYTI